MTPGERVEATLQLRSLWEEDGCPPDLTNFVNRLDVHKLLERLEQEGETYEEGGLRWTRRSG